jgi:hypothetical protein
LFWFFTHCPSLGIIEEILLLYLKNLLTFFHGIYFALLIRLPRARITRSMLCEGFCDCRSESSMSTLDIVLLATFWYMVKSVPGLMQFVGYFFGFVLASWAFDQYFRRD